ncbi:MAG: hypothetical protein IJ191_01045 [Treponema sp.]|nr:hypothetical protein [Treponema sp.]
MSLFGWFGKRTVVFKEQNKPLWSSAQKAMRQAGLKNVLGSYYETELSARGCCDIVDIRDFFPGGKRDTNMYCISTRTQDAAHAREIIERLRTDFPDALSDRRIKTDGEPTVEPAACRQT